MSLYNDEDISITLDGKTVRIGTVEPKLLSELSEEVFQKIGLASTGVSAILFETLQAQGTNIVMQDSPQGVITQIIPRSQDDGINFQWKPSEVSEAELQEMSSKISDVLSTPKVEAKPQTLEKVPEKPVSDEYSEDSYLIKHLERKP